jgi:HEAT repeat protein
MMSLKRLAALALAFVAAASLVMAQSSGNNSQEMTVEESYLQESVEMMVIREQSRGESRENKLIALEYIGDALSRGNTGEDVRAALEYIALEGLLNRTYENGRLVNNYPDVRTKAMTYLGELGTAEAKDTLLKVMLAENEPMVLTEAVKSLGKFGLNENDEAASTSAWIVTRFDVLNPDNLLALAALDAYESLAAKNGGIKDPSAIRTIMRISEGRYIKPVQERAKQVLKNISKYAAQSRSSS